MTTTSSIAQVSTSSGADPVTRINHQLKQSWQDNELTPSRRAEAADWCRRVYLDLLGRIPTRDELRAFLSDRGAKKRTALVQSLLYDEQYQTEYADRWATLWTNVLIGRTGGRQRNSLTNRQGMHDYLNAAFLQNRPYDEMVEELIVATGTNRPGTADFNGAVNFLSDKLQEDAVQATARTARVFLGTQVQCTQCHNHPFNDWKQNQFWELNSFFRQTVSLRRFREGTRNVAYVELANQDFAGEGRQPSEAEVYFEQRNGILKAAFPVFIDGQALEDRSGYIRDVNRREALAQFVLDAPELSLAIVNRYWSYLLGYGFTEPIDDLGPHNAPTHPELFEQLAQDFRDADYDLKQLLRWIALSDAYGLSSRAGSRNGNDDPQLGQTPQFSRFYLRQLRPEELYASMVVASYDSYSFEKRQQHRPGLGTWLRQFSRAVANDEGDETTTFNGTIPQTLMMFNGALMQSALETKKQGSMLGSLLNDKKNMRQKIQVLYLTALSRRPTKKELRTAEQLFAANQQPGDNRGRAPENGYARTLQDIYWALLNSSEFILNH